MTATEYRARYAAAVADSARTQRVARDFLSLPDEALPGARFAREDDSWRTNAWRVVREHVRTGEPVESLCGTRIVLSADRDGWRDGVTI